MDNQTLLLTTPGPEVATRVMLEANITEPRGSGNSRQGYFGNGTMTDLYADNCPGGSSFELVMIALTFPLWTFITLYVLLLLIYYLRKLQYFSLYDKCTSRQAHFRYDFHLIVGRHSHNFNKNDHLILDLLDNQTIVSMTIQIPGNTIYNDQQRFLYRHARNNHRCVTFTVYRRNPIKDVKCIRVAHSCSAPDSRVFIYGVDVHDQTNGESRFFPVQSVVKYRGTQWALVTTFEPKPDLSFKKLGLDCYDPLGYSIWPTYLETLTLILYIWCSSFCFGHLISVKEISNNVPLHALTLLFIVATSAAVLSAIYLRLIKTHILDLHYDSYCWHLAQYIYVLLVILVSLAFWSLALNQSRQCRPESIQWLTSTASCSLILTTLVVLIWVFSNLRRRASDRTLLADTDATMIKTNSKDALLFMADPAPGLCNLFTPNPKKQRADSLRVSVKAPAVAPAAAAGAAAAAAAAAASAPPQSPATAAENSKASGSGGKRAAANQETAATTAPAATTGATGAKAAAKTGDDETLDNSFNQGSKYMKTRNRNSISQYV